MKAKDVLRRTNKRNKVYGGTGGSSPLEKAMIEAMKEYAKLKCAEQRQLCADECSAFDRGDMGYKDWMIDAPEPEFE